MEVIAGDVGGTKTLLARCEVTGTAVRVLHAERVESRGYARFEDLLRAVAPRLGAHSAAAVCLGVAGPVEGDVCRATNLPWTLDARLIAATLGLARGRWSTTSTPPPRASRRSPPSASSPCRRARRATTPRGW
ncbi:MAG: glucokinase [Polyangiales bacterium]